MTYNLNLGLLSESELQRSDALHTVLVHVCLTIATIKIKTFTNMALKTAK
jgi:hypothetical protein